MRTVSVIIPTNRLNQWMNEAVESVLASRGVDVDLVVVIDGNDVADLPEWSLDPRVRIVRHAQSLGPSAGMRSGLAIARSDLVARLDSDDINLPQRLEMQSRFLDEHPEAAAVSSRTMRIDEAGNATGLVKLPAGDDIRGALLLSNVVPHSSLMFRKSIAALAGGYDVALRQMEDYDFILRMARMGSIAQLDDALVQYRVHSVQTSRGAKPYGAHIRQVVKGRRALARHLKTAGVVSEAKNAIWIGAQYLRYFGLVKPGHER